jgi:hypothetical protein
MQSGEYVTNRPGLGRERPDGSVRGQNHDYPRAIPEANNNSGWSCCLDRTEAVGQARRLRPNASADRGG